MHHARFVGFFDGVVNIGQLEQDHRSRKVWLGDPVIVEFQGEYKPVTRIIELAS